MKEQLVDPADKVKKEKEEKEVFDKMKAFDIDELSLTDFKPIPKATALSVHPFEHYELKGTVKIGEADVSSTHIVGLHPNIHVHQDPSGVNLTITPKKKGPMKTATIASDHSRPVVDYESGGINTICVFGNIFKLKDGEIRCAVVRSHSARAQICFKTDPATGRMDVDERYLLLDNGQKNLLRKLYIMIHSPQANIERLSRAISGESEESLEEIPE